MSSEHTYTFKQPSEPVVDFMNMKPNSNISFHNGDKQVGALDFNGPEMTFEGDADESAKVFFDFIAKTFKARLEQERADERNSWPAEMGAMERQVNILTDALAEQKPMHPEIKKMYEDYFDKCFRESSEPVPENFMDALRLDTAMRDVDAMVAVARADEREACAKVCDDAFSSSHAGRVICSNLAAAIRARSDT